MPGMVKLRVGVTARGRISSFCQASDGFQVTHDEIRERQLAVRLEGVLLHRLQALTLQMGVIQGCLHVSLFPQLIIYIMYIP